MTKPVKWMLLGAIMLIIIGMIVYPRIKQRFSSGDDAPPPPTAFSRRGAPISVNAIVLKRQSLSDKINRPGITIPDEEVNLSFESSGKITDIFFQEGTHVQKGDLLAKINDKPLQAELKKLEAQIPLARERVIRQRTLLEKEAVSQDAYEQITTALEVLQADIELIKARILQTELRAPFDGIVGLRQVSEGAYATPSTVIVNLTRISPLKIEFSFPERYVSDITTGTNITFNIEDVNQMMHQYKAKVYAVEAKIAPETVTMSARALYPNENEGIVPGRYISVEIVTKEIENTLTVPSEAIIPEMGRSIVYVYRSGEARATEINTGQRTESFVQVMEGLALGDTVITTGVMQLRTGMRVTIDNLTE